MPTWADFQQKHVLNPDVEPGYASWDREQWNTWLKTRLPGDYGSRGLNSVIVGRPDAIKRSLEAGLSAEMEFSCSSCEQCTWSHDQFQLYVLRKNNHDKTNKYDVFNLGQMYFVARLNEEHEPVHFHGQSPTQIPTGKLPNAFSRHQRIE